MSFEYDAISEVWAGAIGFFIGIFLCSFFVLENLKEWWVSIMVFVLVFVCLFVCYRAVIAKVIYIENSIETARRLSKKSKEVRK